MAVTTAGSGTRTPPLGTVTVTIASPAVFSYTAHGLVAGDKVTFTTTGALPTGLTAGTTYFVIAAGLAANAFEVSATDGGSAVNTSGTQSGTHSIVSELVLLDTSAAATYQGVIDATNMLASDVVEVRVYEKIDATNLKVVYKGTLSDAQSTDDLGKLVGPWNTDQATSGATRLTIKQTAGTARAFPWRVRKFA